MGFEIHAKGELGAAVILHDVLQYCAAAADAVHIDVLLRDPDALGGAHGLLIRRISTYAQVKVVRIQVVPLRRHHAVPHAVLIDCQLHAAALAAGVKPELLVEGHAVRGRDGEFVVLLRADHIRAVDRDDGGRLHRRAEGRVYLELNRHTLADHIRPVDRDADTAQFLRKGRDRAERQHHAKGKQDAEKSFFHSVSSLSPAPFSARCCSFLMGFPMKNSSSFLRRQQAVQGKFVAHGKLAEQLLHDRLGNAAHIQPRKKEQNLLHLVLRHLVAPQRQGHEFL